MHLIAGMADHAPTTLIKCETLNVTVDTQLGPILIRKSDMRLIEMACKALSKHCSATKWCISTLYHIFEVQ